MAKKSYHNFLYEGKICNFETLEKYAKNHNGRIGKYKDKIFCPECGIARLKYVYRQAQKSGYLACISLSEHSEVCSYKNKSQSSNNINNYKKIEELDQEQRNSKMASLLKKLYNTNEELNNKKKLRKSKNKTNSEKEDTSSVKKANNQVKYTCLNKNVDIEKLKKDHDLKIFYASNVSLKYHLMKKKDNKTTNDSDNHSTKNDGNNSTKDDGNNEPYYLPYFINKSNEKIFIYFPGNNNSLGKAGRYNIVCIGKFNKHGLIQLDEPKINNIMVEFVKQENN